MLWKYSIVCLAICAILTFLRFVEDSPIRSWKTVFFTAIPLSFIACYYVNCAFPPAPPPQTRAAKVASNRAELERTFRRIEGVTAASINGSFIELNFAQEKPLADLKRIAQSSGGTAANFLQNGGSNHITVHITVNGSDRYKLEYDVHGRIVSEETY